ncbi:hypothetical protein D3C72_1335940 [compost metagenome]
MRIIPRVFHRIISHETASFAIFVLDVSGSYSFGYTARGMSQSFEFFFNISSNSFRVMGGAVVPPEYKRFVEQCIGNVRNFYL